MLTFLKLGRLGRMGNAMFQIASTIGIATKNGYDYAFPYWKNYDQLLLQNSAECFDLQSYFVNHLPLLPEREFRAHGIPWGFQEYRIPDNLSLDGHMQSEKYFAHCANTVRHYFQLKTPEKFLADKIKDIGYTGIHIRLGDYVKLNHYHPVQPISYYEAAMAHFPPGTPFLIFSDDIQRAKEIFKDVKADFAQGNNMVEDLYCMTQCDNFIISNSTFSWWGAWLGPNKKVIAPSSWFGPAAGGLSPADIYCENWTVI